MCPYPTHTETLLLYFFGSFCITPLSYVQEKKKVRFSMFVWGMAYDQWALAAAAMGQIDYAVAKAHYANCMRIASSTLSFAGVA